LARPLPDAPEVQFLPDAFRVIATDQEPGLSARDNETYKALVFERLIAAKLYPAAARQRRAKGIALVNFMLDSAGQVAGVSLIRSSGDGDLDREALAMVKRAAPYPPPPSGAVRLFSPLIEFGSEDQEPNVNPSGRP
jgi:TonB family protein